MFDELPEDAEQLDALIDSAPRTHFFGILSAEVLLVALFEAEENSGSTARGRELARLALVAAVDGVMTLRANDLTILVEDAGRALDDDELLAALASRALATADDEATRAGQWVSALLPEYVEPVVTEVPAVEKPRGRTRLIRHLGEVTGVQLGENAGVWFLVEGMRTWLSATPDLAERAWSLHRAPVEVLTILTPQDPLFVGWHSHTWRLVRIDPAVGEEQAPDSATRTQDMLQDWDELLHRLAR